MVALNVALLVAQLLVLGSVAVGLHAVRARWGYAPLILFVGCLVTFLHAVGPTPVFLEVWGLRIVTSDVAIVPVVLLVVLLIYDIDGTVPARVLVAGVIGVSLAVLAFQVMRDLHGILPGGMMAGSPDAPTVAGRAWRITLASVTAFTLSLVVIAAVQQALRNAAPWAPAWVAPGVALTAALATDDVVFRTGAFGVAALVENFPGGLVAKASSALLLLPIAAAYLARVDRREGRSSDTRRTFDLVFGRYAEQAEVVRSLETRSRRTEERLSAVVSAAPVVIAAVDRDGTITLAEGAGLARLGLEPAAVVGASVFELVPGVADTVRRALAGEAFTAVLGGSEATYEVAFVPTREGDEVVGFTGVATDITAKRRAERALEASETRFRTTFERAPVGMVQCDTTGVVVQANPAFQRMLGYGEAELRGRRFQELTHPEDVARDERGMAALLHGDASDYHADNRYRHREGGWVWANVHVSLVRRPDSEPDYFVAAVEDLTERRAADEKLRQAQKMEAVGQLTGGVAHDFNNLLTVVMGGLELVLEAGPEHPDTRETLEAALTSARKGAALTQRLLAFSRRQTLQPVPVDVGSLLGETRDLLARTLGEDIEIELDVAPDTGACIADPHQMENALLNLALNSRDAMPEGGDLVLGARRARLSAQDAATREVRPGHFVEVWVRDSGFGIEEEHRARAFEPFFTTKEVGKGSGLGLSMVFGFARQSGGTVAIESAVGSGTTVTLTLPAGGAATVEAPGAALSGPAAARPGRTILLVEDDPAVRTLMDRMLTGLGYQVVSAERGSEALELLAHFDVDLLLTDVVLPGGMNGPALAQKIAARRPDLPTVFTSGYTGAGLIDRGGLPAGARLLSKPFTREDLVRVVTAALA